MLFLFSIILIEFEFLYFIQMKKFSTKKKENIFTNEDSFNKKLQ